MERSCAVWKVYNIETGQTVKAGFDDEDAAKEWVEKRQDLLEEDHDIEEMDEDEEEEYLEEHGDEEDDDGPPVDYGDDIEGDGVAPDLVGAADAALDDDDLDADAPLDEDDDD